MVYVEKESKEIHDEPEVPLEYYCHFFQKRIIDIPPR